MNVEKFKAAHIAEIDLHPSATPWREFGDAETAAALERAGGYTVRVDGRVVLLGGLVQASKDVGLVWSMLSRDSGPYMLALTRIALRAFHVSGLKRIIANTECDFAAGHRWLEILGFTPTEKVPGWGLDGRDHQFFVRVS